MEKCEEKEDGSRWFTVTTKSIPSPCFVQWSMTEKNSNTFKVIDVSVEDYKGTSNSLPHPVLVINHSKQLKTHCFQIEVQNFIGSCKKTIPGISLNKRFLLFDKKYIKIRNLFQVDFVLPKSITFFLDINTIHQFMCILILLRTSK